MSLLTIAVIAVIVAAAFVVLIVIIFLDWKLFDFVMNLGVGKGPLDVQAALAGKRVTLTVLNNGKNSIRLAAVEGRDTNGRRIFPTPSLDAGEMAIAMDKPDRFKQLARIVLSPGESRTIMLDRDELVELNCRALGILRR